MTNVLRLPALFAGAILLAAAAPPPGLLSRITVQGEAAKKMLEKSEITVDAARQIIDGCLAFARAHGDRVSVAIYDQFGVPVLIHRMDGQGKFDVESAMLKARTVLNTRAPSHLLLNDVLTGDTTDFHQQHFHGNYSDKGGLPIRAEDQFLGAIGVGGSEHDEECARAGLETVLGPQPALTPDVTPRRPAGE